VQSLIPVAGAAQVLLSVAISFSTQANPAAVLQGESSTQGVGQAVAATQALPAVPKSQHVWPLFMSQS
jgi:hypothetical protein